MMFTVLDMHPTTDRLYKALSQFLSVESVGSTLAAKTLGLSSAQTVSNWEDRGVSQKGIVKASTLCSIRTAWIERGELPMFEKKSALVTSDDASSAHIASDSIADWAPESSKIMQALGVLETALCRLDLHGRERAAPLFESFARSPGTIVKNDIASLLENPESIKSYELAQKARLQKTG